LRRRIDSAGTCSLESPVVHIRPPTKEAVMVTYLMLLNWTDQGIKNVKDSPKRLDGVKKLAKDMGGEVKSFYMTLGAHDLVLIVDMPNNDKLASFGLKLGSLGNVRSTTLRAYSEDDYRRIISGLS
jgi:uncharacterized protein with GYD domain